jgi:hypothetical protein
MALLKSNKLFACFGRSGFPGLFNLCRSLNGNRGLLALFELIYRTGCVQQFLLAGVKRMALATDFRVK